LTPASGGGDDRVGIGDPFEGLGVGVVIFEEATAAAVKEVIAEQFAAEMKPKGIAKVRMTEPMKTSRAQVDGRFPELPQGASARPGRAS
jgi:hypothetical protein